MLLTYLCISLCFSFLPFSHPNFKYSIPELTLVPRYPSVRPSVRQVVWSPFVPQSLVNLSPSLSLAPSKLDESVKLKPVKPREKLGSFQAGQQITCFVSKVRYGSEHFPFLYICIYIYIYISPTHLLYVVRPCS